jgi:hypothetical protein
MKTITRVNTYGFRLGFDIDSSHIIVNQADAVQCYGGVGAGFRIFARADNIFTELHAFQVYAGIDATSTSFPLIVNTFHAEGVSYPYWMLGTMPAYFENVFFESSTYLTGDITNSSRCNVTHLVIGSPAAYYPSYPLV